MPDTNILNSEIQRGNKPNMKFSVFPAKREFKEREMKEVRAAAAATNWAYYVYHVHLAGGTTAMRKKNEEEGRSSSSKRGKTEMG